MFGGEGRLGVERERRKHPAASRDAVNGMFVTVSVSACTTGGSAAGTGGRPRRSMGASAQKEWSIHFMRAL